MFYGEARETLKAKQQLVPGLRLQTARQTLKRTIPLQLFCLQRIPLFPPVLLQQDCSASKAATQENRLRQLSSASIRTRNHAPNLSALSRFRTIRASRGTGGKPLQDHCAGLGQCTPSNFDTGPMNTSLQMVESGLLIASNQSHRKPNGVEETVTNGGTNSSFPREELFQLPTFSTAAKVRVAITILLFLSSAFFNIAVLWTVAQKYHRRPHVRILLMNLAAADLLVTFVVMPLDAAWNVTVQWYAGDLACRVLMFLKLMAMYASAFITVVISLDRRAAILNPLRVSEAKRKNKVMLCVAWALSLLLASPQIFVFHTVSRSQPVYFIQCATVGSFRAHWQETLYNMFTFCCLFLLPLTIMILCYTRIFVEISRKMKKVRASSKSRDVHLRRSYNNIPRARMRTLKMSAVIVFTFVICWTPYYLLGLWYWFSPEMLTQEQVPPSLSHILFLFGLFNTCLDPIVYGLFAVHFRAGSRWACCCTRNTMEPEAVSMFSGSFRASAGPIRRPGENQEHFGKDKEEPTRTGDPAGTTLKLYRRTMTESII